MSLQHHIDVETIAGVCYAANRAWARANGDYSHAEWENAEQHQRDGIMEGVQRVIEGNLDPRAQHEAWCESKRADGWTYGPVKDGDAKTHPCLVAYDELPPVELVKDYIFIAIASTLARVSGAEA